MCSLKLFANFSQKDISFQVIPRAKNYYNKVSALPKNIQIRSKHTENTMCFRHHTCDILFLLSMNFLCVSVLLTCLVDAQNYHYSKGWAAGKRSFLAERMSHVLKRFDNGPDTILRVSKSLKKSQNMPNEMLDISEVLQRSQNVPKRILGMSKAQQGPDTLHTRILGMTNSLKRSENVLELLDMSKILKRAEEVPEAIQEMSKVLARSDDVPKRILDMSKVHRGSEIMPDNILEMPKVPKRLEIVPDEILALTENDMSITWKRSHNLPDTLPQDSTDFDQLGQKLSRRNFGAHHAAVSLQGAWDDGPGSGYRGSSLKGEGRRKDDKKHRCGFKKDMEELLAEIFEASVSWLKHESEKSSFTSN